MKKFRLSETDRAYLAGFLDADGSIYVRAKPNPTYRFGYQIAPAIVFFQSAKARKSFEKMCALMPFGSLRERKDGVCEYTIRKLDDLEAMISLVEPYIRLKTGQVGLLKEILSFKKREQDRIVFAKLLKLVDSFRELNYSKKRIRRILPVETER